jgi:hypothetical protein
MALVVNTLQALADEDVVVSTVRGTLPEQKHTIRRLTRHLTL